jgi:hypothetical protein
MASVENLGNYSPEDVIVILSNNEFSHTISGMADGTFISYEREIPRATLYTGSDLTAARVLRRNKSGTVTITLHQSAESNDILSELARLDEESHNNSWLFSVTIKDMMGRSLFYSPQAFIGNDPMVTYSTELETREWTIQVISVERHFGGNSKLNTENIATLEGFGYTVEDQWKNT